MLNNILAKTLMSLLFLFFVSGCTSTNLERQKELLQFVAAEYDFSYHCDGKSCHQRSFSNELKEEQESYLLIKNLSTSVNSNKPTISVSLKFTQHPKQEYLYTGSDWKVTEIGCTVHLELPGISVVGSHAHNETIQHNMVLAFTSGETVKPFYEKCQLTDDLEYKLWTFTYFIEHEGSSHEEAHGNSFVHNRTHGGGISR